MNNNEETEQGKNNDGKLENETVRRNLLVTTMNHKSNWKMKQ